MTESIWYFQYHTLDEDSVPQLLPQHLPYSLPLVWCQRVPLVRRSIVLNPVLKHWQSIMLFLSSLKGEKEQSIEKLTASVKEWRLLIILFWTMWVATLCLKLTFILLLDYKKIHDSSKWNISDSLYPSLEIIRMFCCSSLWWLILAYLSSSEESGRTRSAVLSSLNKQSLYKGTKPKMLMAYREFLERTESLAFTPSHSSSFLQVEDVLFRSFLSQLYDMNDVSYLPSPRVQNEYANKWCTVPDLKW